MKCYYHRHADAIGACKSCNKGICAECVADVGNGVACKDKCEQQVRSLNLILQHSIRAVTMSEQLGKSHSNSQFPLGAFATAAGLIFMFLGINIPGVVPKLGVTSLGITLTLFGVCIVASVWRIGRIDKQTRNGSQLGH